MPGVAQFVRSQTKFQYSDKMSGGGQGYYTDYALVTVVLEVTVLPVDTVLTVFTVITVLTVVTIITVLTVVTVITVLTILTIVSLVTVLTESEEMSRFRKNIKIWAK